MVGGEGIAQQGCVVLTLRFERADGEWLGTCIELSTSTSAGTLEEAQEALHDLVTLHLNTLEDLGERNRFLAEHDIKVHHGEIAPAGDVALSSLNLDLARLLRYQDLVDAPLYQPHPFRFSEPERATPAGQPA